MNSFKRAFLYITRKRGKSLLLALIIIVISTLVLSGLASLDAEAQQSTDLRGATGTSFSVERESKWGDSKQNGQGGSTMTDTADLISREMVEKIAGSEGIKGYDALYQTVLQLLDKGRKPLNSGSTSGQTGQFLSYGSINSEYSAFFLQNKFMLAEGRHLTKDDKNGILISSDAAKKNGLKVGDKIQAVNDPKNKDPYIELEIVGIFDVIADKEEAKDKWSLDAWYDYSSYAFVSMDAMEDLLVNYKTDGPNKGYITADFFVEDPEQLESVIRQVQNIEGIDWKNYTIKANDEVYERTAGSMDNISTLIRTLILVIVVISMGIVTLILSMWVKSRTRETGVLLATGITKASILFQHILEVGVIALVGFPLSFLCAKTIAGAVGGMFGKTGAVIVTTQHFAMVCGWGALLLILAILISCIPTMRLKPKEILSKMG